MFFNAKISVTVTSQTTGRVSKIQTIHSVHTKNDSKEIGASCDIIVPLNCRIQYQDGAHDFLTAVATTLFTSGDAIKVVAHYETNENGVEEILPDVVVFDGFVYEFIEGTPLKIRCLDNIFMLNQSIINLNKQTIKLKDLLNLVLKGTSITLQLPTLDLSLKNITFRLMSPAAILEWIKKELGLNISLHGKTLYCNVASNTLNTVTFHTARNVIKSDLQKPEAVYLKLQVKCWFIQENGKKASIEVGDPGGELREVFFYRIPFNLATYAKMAAEALTKYKQFKFSGNIESYLYPDCNLFDKAVYIDVRYPARTGNYTVVAINHEIDQKGYHRKIKLAYLSDIPLPPTVKPVSN